MPRLTWFFVAGYVQAHFALIVPLVPLAKILPVTLGALAMSSMAIFVCLMALSNFRSDEAFLGRPTDGCADTMDEERLCLRSSAPKSYGGRNMGAATRKGAYGLIQQKDRTYAAFGA